MSGIRHGRQTLCEPACAVKNTEVLRQFLFMVTAIHQHQQASLFPAPLSASPAI